ncbi:MAG: hypothetical protein M0T70_15000 [Geobacteraceae bacterium]|nr:hypothetical protein [Geobacteraceae bacterium]
MILACYGVERFAFAHDMGFNGKVRLKEFEGRMECNTLNVTDDDFFWSGYYKHTDIRWETDTVRLAVLDEPDIHDEREACGEETGQGESP